MAERAVWRYRGRRREGPDALLMQFSNGRLQNSANVNFTLYKNNDTTNPRKKHRRILVAETDRLSYMGSNFGAGVLKCNSLCSYFVGALNKDSGKMEIFDAELFNMQPVFSDDLNESEAASENQAKTYREKVDSCIEAFGTTKQKRALNARRMNAVGSETLNIAVAKAAENIIDTRGVDALVSEATLDKLQEESVFLPPCHDDGAKPEDVYRFEDLISSEEYEALQTPSEAFKNITSEEILKMVQTSSHCSFVIEALKSLPSNEEIRDHKARCLWYLNTLVRFGFQKVIKRKSALGQGIPHIINSKLLKNFTVLTYNGGRVQNLISASMEAKITAYVIALALHVSDFRIDLTVLQRDMRLGEKRILEIAKAMRLKVSKRPVPVGAEEEDHKMGILTLPLPVYRPPNSQRKRKKMF
ncbi:DNA-directed RNA polymerase I subunit RPA49 isoform X2 [Ornithorhynchus anatinus]|uniref:RNA polymerase I subunit E n=1 Tax=Ornithorhynchus anatinus TaxID=9258 RepID=F6ZES0_ORNAN|nr:DNA-directed RNA polymerase I subunit RPA49 isoform X2 [Ornithorhynchus anatinus]